MVTDTYLYFSKKRPAIAMIELIFAIVIIAIVLMSAPMLISTSSKSSMVALQQESIAAAVAQMNMILTTEWDHMDTNATIGEPVLTTDSTVFNQCTGGATRPKGVTVSNGRYCIGLDGTGVTYAASSIGTDSTLAESQSYDDVDDYNGQSYTVNIYAHDQYATHLGDYIDKNISITSNIYYGGDTPSTGTYGQTTTFANPFLNNTPGGTTNIKLIHVQLTSTNPTAEIADKQINLSAFMCNIGAPTPIMDNESSL